MREDRELKRVALRRDGRILSAQYCFLCGEYLPAGCTCTSYGVFDPMAEAWERIYLCTEHGYLLEVASENLKNYEQRLLISQGFVNEFYDRS